MAYQDNPNWKDDTKTLRVLLGEGPYIFEAMAGTWGGGSIALKRLGPDGVNDLTVYTITAANDASPVLGLPGGEYGITVTTATGISARCVRCGEIR